MITSTRMYDAMKFIVQRLFPAAITLVAGVYALLGHDGTIVVGLLGLVLTFLGNVTGISGAAYAKAKVAEEAAAEKVEDTVNGDMPEDVTGVDQTPAPLDDESEAG